MSPAFHGPVFLSGETVAKYTKPHLSYEQQVALMESRGLIVDNRGDAIHALKRVGYYRLSAYTYVFRMPLPGGTGGSARRTDCFIEGSRFTDAVALCDFDGRLRSTLLAGLQQLELGMRVRIGHQLGKKHPFGHMDAAYLDPERCSQRPQHGGDAATEYDAWRAKYNALCHDARTEDFMTHFLVHYGGELPTWVAMEVMTFGTLTALYYLLEPKDANQIAKGLEVPNRDVLHSWLRALNVLRNNCAHNARIWNRKTVYQPPRPPQSLVPDTLHHLRSADNERLYFLAALTAFLLRELDPDTQWPSQFTTIMGKFPTIDGVAPEPTMGFPAGWRDLSLWKPGRQPTPAR